jgi:hypothetical protein
VDYEFRNVNLMGKLCDEMRFSNFFFIEVRRSSVMGAFVLFPGLDEAFRENLSFIVLY